MTATSRVHFGNYGTYERSSREKQFNWASELDSVVGTRLPKSFERLLNQEPVKFTDSVSRQGYIRMRQEKADSAEAVARRNAKKGDSSNPIAKSFLTPRGFYDKDGAFKWAVGYLNSSDKVVDVVDLCAVSGISVKSMRAILGDYQHEKLKRFKTKPKFY